ncbi:DUF3078 domain-containing protein [Psychroserpens sp. Hel_I_66]|uniref:DUF3078 domain-containing protein n=1 Tax=Psychroserpens sp. Hel_I_66 TaxID=1250004 RepID=UPI00064632E1|nr:DUF3078 domain-containing protein [Psychroserpens sp. Hel_I_66]
MIRIACLLLALSVQFLNAQTDSVSAEKADYKWIQTNKAGLDISEVTFVNWNAGGSNSISALLNVRSELNYDDSYYKWKNSAQLRYGVNKQEAQRLRKTEDELELISTIGYREDTLTNWYFSGRFNFKTQLSNGYNYPNRDNPISRLMAPGYMFLGGGTEYGKNLDKFSLYFSPLTFKATFVLDEDLSNAGSFGVEPAIFDEEGNMISEGERVRVEMGILFTNFYEAIVFENISVKHQLSLYTDYLDNFGNIDVDWEIIFDFKVNQYVKATLGSHIRYDDNIKTLVATDVEDEFEERGAKVQWKQLLGVGVVIDF